MRRIDSEDTRRDSGTVLTEYWRVMWKKRHFVLIPVVLAAVITVVGVQFLKPVYKSSSLIRLEDPNYVAQELSEFLTIEERRQAVDEETLARIRAEIRSSGFVDQVVNHLGLARNPESIERAEELRDRRYPNMPVEEILHRSLRDVLTNKIQVSLEGPGLFEIACRDYSSRNCYLLADAVTTLFIDAQRQKQLRGLEEASEFSDEQLEVHRKRVEASELELRRVQDRMTQLALQSNPVGETAVRYQEEFGGESNLRYAETLKEQLDVGIAELQGIIERTRERLTGAIAVPLTNGAIMDSAELRKLTDNLTAYRRTQLRLELGARGVTTEDLEASQSRIDETESALERQLTLIVASEFSGVDADYMPLIVEYYLQKCILESLQNKRRRLADNIDSFKRKLDLMPQLEAQVTKLEEQVRNDREVYNSFLRAKTSTQIGQAVQKTNLGQAVDVLEPAALPLVPEWPKKKRILLLALIIGGMLGAGGLMLSEYMDSSFRDVESIERELGLRVLGTVPAINDRGAWKKTPTRKQAVVWAATAAVVVALALVGFYMYGRAADRIVVSSSESTYESIVEDDDVGGNLDQ